MLIEGAHPNHSLNRGMVTPGPPAGSSDGGESWSVPAWTTFGLLESESRSGRV